MKAEVPQLWSVASGRPARSLMVSSVIGRSQVTVVRESAGLGAMLILNVEF